MPVNHPIKQDDTAQPPLESYWCRDHHGRYYTHNEALEWIRDFHGHVAPGLIVGLKMVTIAMEQMPGDVLFDVVCETRSCLPDAVQMLTLCTVGNNWLKINDIKRFALTLYDKSNGKGFRVHLDPARLKQWPEFYDWFYKQKARREQNFERLMTEIHHAGNSVFKLSKVQVRNEYLKKHSKGRIETCPVCGEAYPVSQGNKCKGCQGEAPYHDDLTVNSKSDL
jgi:formylmethanofuran dehydrogenase subunit E